MKKSTKIILILAASFVAIGSVLSIIGIIAGAKPIKQFEQSISKYEIYDDDFDESYKNEFNAKNTYEVNPSGINELSIDWVDGNVTIEPYDGTEIILTESSSSKITEKNNLGYRVDEGELEISMTKRIGDFHLSPKDIDIKKDLIIKIPSSLASHLMEISLDGVNTNLVLNEISAGGLSVNTVNGNVIGKNLSLSEIELDTVDGNLDVDLLNCPGEIEVDSVGGNVTIAIPHNSEFTAHLNTASGTLNSEFHDNCAKGYCSTGNGNAQFEMDSVGGDFYIKKSK